MTGIPDEIDDVYRDFVTTGVPASGANEPSKAEIRQLLHDMLDATNTAAAGITTVATTAARDTFYADPDNQSKLVYVNNNNGSATDPANGVYEYVSGVPRIAEGFYQGLSAVVQPLVDEAATSATTATEQAELAASLVANVNSSLSASAVFIVPAGVAFSAGTASAASITLRYLTAALYDWFGATLDIYNPSGSAQTIKLRRFNATTGAQVGSDVAITIQPGMNTGLDASAFAGSAGDQVGGYFPVGSISYLAGTGDQGGNYQSNGDVTTVPAGSSTNRRWQIRINYKYLAFSYDDYLTTKSTSLSNASKVAAVTEQLGQTFLIGRQIDPVAASDANTALTEVFAEQVPSPGKITGFKIYGGTGGGTIVLRKFLLNGTTMTQSGADLATLTVAASVLNTYSLDIDLSGGEYLGWYANAANIFAYSTGTTDTPGRYQASGNATSFTVGAPVTSSRLEAQFELSVISTPDETRTLPDRVTTLEAQAGGLAITPYVKLLSGTDEDLFILADGNSHYAGQGGNVPSPTQLQTFLGMNIPNFGVGGQNTQQMEADASTQIDPPLAASIAAGNLTILIAQEIYNDIWESGKTAAQACDYMVNTYCAHRKAANPGLIIGLCNLADTLRNHTSNPGIVSDANAWLAANAVASGHVDFIIDLWANPELQDCYNTTYFQAVDNTHRTTAGEAIVMKAHRKALRSFLLGL